MAFTHIIRRAASRIVPLAVRSSAGGIRYNHSFSTLLHQRPAVSLLQRSFPSAVHHRFYSSKAKSDESLLRVIESEIQCAEESGENDEIEEVPAGFPFKIEDHPGQQTVTLTREYDGETISVEVHMPDLVTGEENENDEDDDEERGNQSTISLVVRVSKGTKPVLEFGCTAYPDEVAIDSLSVKDPHSSEEEIAYEGPDFADLDENLQKAFHKYLEIRGIKPSTTNFLHEYMIEKDNREYKTWLKNLKKFIEA